MNANSTCIACIIRKQEEGIRHYTDERKKTEYMIRLLEVIAESQGNETSGYLAVQVDKLHREFWGEITDYTEIKHKYNQLLLGKEQEIEQRLLKSSDPVKECIKYVCAANYIDFGVLDNVNEVTFEKILEKAKTEVVPEDEYAHFTKDLKQAETLAYLTDNCGEIVLDKLFIKHIKKAYPKLQVTVVVRGEDTINDATLSDAREVGLTDLVPCIGNGNAAPGTVMNLLSKEAKDLLANADMIISKGMGNFESVFGEGLNPYYLFLCKCELFTRRFGLAQYESVFRKEERIHINH